MPERIRLRRAEGWRKPADTVVVSRPSRWGNPAVIGKRFEGEIVRDRAHAAELYRNRLLGDPALVAAVRRELAGKNLACWCPEDEPCHADVLLEIANS